MKIACVGLYNETNLGDPILARCSEWIIEQVHPEVQITKRVPLDHAEKKLGKNNLFIHKCVLKLVYLAQKFFDHETSMRWYWDYRIHCNKRYFRKEFKDADFAICVGGGLIKYKKQTLWRSVSGAIEAAAALNKPMILNAVGIEGYSNSNYRCQLLKRHLSLNAVRYITTRDDIDTLRNKYLDHNPSIPCQAVADPAVWAAECYGILKEKESNTIGIGVARGDIFKDYGVSLSSDELKRLYIELSLDLVKQGYDIEIFTNGAEADKDMAMSVYFELDEIAKSGISLRLESKPEQLVAQIASYKAIIATRLHACIIAYSLDIPAIGLVWNDKQMFFGKNIGAPDYFVTRSDFDTKNIIRRLEDAISKGYDETRREEYRSSIVESMKSMLSGLRQ